MKWLLRSIAIVTCVLLSCTTVLAQSTEPPQEGDPDFVGPIQPFQQPGDPGFVGPIPPSRPYIDPGLYNPDAAITNPYDQPFIVDPTFTSQQLAPDLTGENYLLRIINWMVFFLGIIAFFFTLYAGFMYIIALDKEEYVTKGRQMLVYIVIGVIIVLGSYAIVFTFLGGRGRLFFF